jgi:hypothetical protein
VDTRKKIVAIDCLPALLAGGEWKVIAGLFDPMTAAQARRIARESEGGRKLLAVVLDEGETLLPAAARAALVAGLRAVDAVIIARAEQWAAPLEELDGERARTAEFVRFVIDRAASSAGAER